MAYTAADGIPSLNATWAFEPFDSDPPPVINDQGAGASLTPPVPTLPWTKLLAAPALRSSPDADDNRVPRTLEEGEYPLPGEVGGKTVILRCEVRALTEVIVDATMTALLNGYTLDMTNEGVMTVTPYEYVGGVVWTFGARVLHLDADDAWSHFPRRRAPFRWGFSLSLRMSIPRFFTDDVGYR